MSTPFEESRLPFRDLDEPWHERIALLVFFRAIPDPFEDTEYDLVCFRVGRQEIASDGEELSSGQVIQLRQRSNVTQSDRMDEGSFERRVNGGHYSGPSQPCPIYFCVWNP